MTAVQVSLVESCVGQVERNSRRFAEDFVREIDSVASIAPDIEPAHLQIDPLEFICSARDRFRQFDQSVTSATLPDLLPEQEFNIAANAMLRALARTLGAALNAETREAWIAAFRTIADHRAA